MAILVEIQPMNLNIEEKKHWSKLQTNARVAVQAPVSLPPPLERARCRDIGLPPTWSIATRETDSTHISQLKTPHLDKLIESKWARGQGAARGWTESWQGAERRELR